MIGIAILAFFGVIIGLIVIVVALKMTATQWLELRRKFRAMQSGWPRSAFLEQYQPLETGSAWREPLPFEATKPCPHCGFVHTHMLIKPNPDTINLRPNSEGKWRPVAYAPWVRTPARGDHPEAATVRRCNACGHLWGEK